MPKIDLNWISWNRDFNSQDKTFKATKYPNRLDKENSPSSIKPKMKKGSHSHSKKSKYISFLSDIWHGWSKTTLKVPKISWPDEGPQSSKHYTVYWFIHP